MLTRFTFSVLVVSVLLSVGCAHLVSDPLQGWKRLGSVREVGSPFARSIHDDYQDYIRGLPDDERSRIDDFGISFLEDTTGQRAVEIYIPRSGVRWKHVLIYDTDGKRTKVIKYASSRYMS